MQPRGRFRRRQAQPASPASAVARQPRPEPGDGGCHVSSQFERVRAPCRRIRDRADGRGRGVTGDCAGCARRGARPDHGRGDQAAAASEGDAHPCEHRSPAGPAHAGNTDAATRRRAGPRGADHRSDAGDRALAGVSTVRQDQINQIMPTRPADLIYGMPGVHVQHAARRSRHRDQHPRPAGFRPRQRGVDGARQNFQRTGHNANGMFYLEPEMLAASTSCAGRWPTFYGSGAIGGVVSFRTKDVEDVLKVGERWGVLAHTMGSSTPGGVSSAFAAARLAPEASNCSRAAPTARSRATRMATAASFRIPTTRSTRASGRERSARRLGTRSSSVISTTTRPTPPASRFRPARRRLRRRSTRPARERARDRTLDLFAAGRSSVGFRRQRLLEQDRHGSEEDRRHRRSGVGVHRRPAQLHHQHQRFRCQQHDPFRHRAAAARSELRRRQFSRRGRHDRVRHHLHALRRANRLWQLPAAEDELCERPRDHHGRALRQVFARRAAGPGRKATEYRRNSPSA